MSYKQLELREFLSDIERKGINEDGVRYTWLIGSGFSASAGIPVAKEISDILATYEFIARNKKQEFKNYLQGFSYTQNHLKNYFNWYFTFQNQQNQEYNELIKESYAWLKNCDNFGDIAIGSPECYRFLFNHFVDDQTDQHYFITSLIQRNTGINVAHMGLAGLLRDYPYWGHTVFTTNFDDLLLKATLALNHTMRIFGEIRSTEEPSSSPTYPQVVHLHGRHTGYNLLNTSDQISTWYTPNLKNSFENHIHDSHLLVIGYSGWDDLVMQTLEKWNENNRQLLRGNIYWVPYKYQNEEYLETGVKNFLNKCPVGKAYVITTKEQNLNADSFILSLCNVINKKNGGFGSYRKDIIESAKEQHAFIMQQLKEYPDENPEDKIEKLITEAKGYIQISSLTQAFNALEEALKIIGQPDLHGQFKPIALRKIGVLYYKMGQTSNSSKILTESLNYFKSITNPDLNVKFEIAKNQRILAEVLINQDRLEEAYKHIQNCTNLLYREILPSHHSKDSKEVKENLILAKMTRIYIDLLLGHIYTVDFEISEIDDSIGILEDNMKAMGKYLQIKAICLILKKEFESSKILFENSSYYFSKIPDTNNQKLNSIYIACIDMKQKNFDSAIEEIESSKKYFQSMGDSAGSGICYNLIGYFNSLKNDTDKEFTEAQYLLSINEFKKDDSSYNLTNVLVDLYIHKASQGITESAEEVLTDIKSLNLKKHKYFNECL